MTDVHVVCPGRSAPRSGALQTRDRYEHRRWNGPGPAAHYSALCAPYCAAPGTPLPEYLLVELRPALGVGVDLVRAVDDGLEAALLGLELRDLGGNVGVHRQVVGVPEDRLSGARRHEVDEQSCRVRVRGAGGDAGDLERLGHRIERHPL